MDLSNFSYSRIYWIFLLPLIGAWAAVAEHVPEITFDENNILKIIVTLNNPIFKPEYYIASVNNAVLNRNAVHITQDMLNENINGNSITYTITREYDDSRTFKRLKIGYTSPEYGTFYEIYSL